MRKGTFIILGLLLGAICLALSLYRPDAPVNVGVGFLGYTNGVTGGRLARFGFTNQSGVTIRRWGHFDREVNKLPLLASTLNLGSQVLLSPGQAEVISVPLAAEPAVTYQRNWRAVFYWRRENWQTRSLLWLQSSPWLPDWLPWLSNWIQRRGIRVQRAPSEWMDR